MTTVPTRFEEDSASGFNEHHKRHIQVTFQHINDLLGDAEFAMLNADSPSPFQKHANDSTPIQRKVMHDYIVRIREAMRRILAELDITPSPPACGALAAASAAVLFSNIDIEEMGPQKMLGYGKLSEQAVKTLHEICVEMQGLLGKLNGFLAGGDGDLQARLARLEKTGDEIALLRELERIMTANGLVEFRGTLAMLLDRIESTVFEIGVFGRVSSGKSSLLDYLLETTALPVGVTPVTAIPTRVSFGDPAAARVEFADRAPRTVDLSSLPEYAAEQQNPGNAKHVTPMLAAWNNGASRRDWLKL